MKIDKLSSSGKIRKNETGAIRDNAEGKGRFDLIPFDAMRDLKLVDCLLEGQDDKHYALAGIFSALEVFVQEDDIELLLEAVVMYSRDRYGSLEKAFLEVSHRFEAGATKYGTHNWQKGMPYSWFIDSGVRHLLMDAIGLDDEPHDQAFIWNMICLISTYNNNKTMNDIEYMVRGKNK